MWSINELQNVWHLAAKLHNGQKYGGQEEGEKMNSDLAIKCAVLHDSIEDTEQSFEQIKELFGLEVALGIMALTKDKQLQPKEKMMLDSLNRIKKQPKEVWAVKMADRICNLYAPPYSWSKERKEKYLKEARLIHRELKNGNKYLANRLEEKINEYSKYF